jgi:ABC-type sugar transport system ATPase subunit
MSVSARSVSEARPFLVARGLVKRYPGVVALDHADAAITPGVVLGLLGKNGAGKSTLIKVLAGAVAPDEGELLLDDEPVVLHGPHDATKFGLAFVHQELADVPNLTVAENIELGLGYPKFGGVLVNNRALRSKAQEALSRLDPRIDAGAPLGGLSIAQRRLVMIARGLAANARLLVLDEPTASLTDEEISHLHEVVRGLRDRGVAVIYVTHRLGEVFEITDSVAVMRDGKVVFAGPTASVTRPQLIEHITGTAAARTREPWRPPQQGDRDELLRVEDMTLPGVVEHASFSVLAGDILGLAGLVGAGRTELVRLIFGADPRTAGRVFVRGVERRIRGPRDAMAAGVVLLPEDRRNQGTITKFSVRKNITLATLRSFRLRGPLPVPHRGRETSAARDLVQRLDIKVADPEHPIRYLSGGNQQKVVLAKWLRSGADVFIFDEPTQGIDVGAKDEFYGLMRDLAAEGKGVVFISSEFSELVQNCNRVMVMREGHLVGELAGEEVTESALLERCYAA